jgi:hypothetical protein
MTPLADVLRRQSRICTSLGSPMYGELLERIAADVEAGGVFADVLDGHEDDPIDTAIALRLVGGLHRLVFGGNAPALNRWYPSAGGSWDAEAAWADVTDAAVAHRAGLRAALDRVPQTNEVGRSAALIGALLRLVDRSPMPVRLFEIGASAGLNLRADQYLYRYADGQWGPAGSTVVIDDAWQGLRPPDVPLRIVERHGFDIAPVDAISADGRLTLLSYVWPDMPVRLHRLQGAIDIARRVPAGLDRMSAADAVAGLRLVRGTLTVLWHSITWQYLSDDEQAAVTDRAVELGERADAATPFVWLCLEPIRRTPGGRHEFLVRARSWPDGTDEILGVCSPHGPPVHWE